MAAMQQTTPEAARTRYSNAFSSSIFDGPSEPKGQGFVPAGKRRDQTTQEMFGTYAEKDLRSMPKTFVPKDDQMSPRNKKTPIPQLRGSARDRLCSTSQGGIRQKGIRKCRIS